MLEAPVLPPPQQDQSNEPQGLPQPPPSQPTSRESLTQRAVPRPSSSKQPQSEPPVGYQGTPQAQRTVEDIMGDYTNLKVTNSGPTGTPLRKQAIQFPNKENIHLKCPPQRLLPKTPPERPKPTLPLRSRSM